jgi:hypothetical protein
VEGAWSHEPLFAVAQQELEPANYTKIRLPKNARVRLFRRPFCPRGFANHALDVRSVF